MSEPDKHEWASGVHAALFSLALILGSIAWGNKFALALILIAQGLAYLSRVIAVWNLGSNAAPALVASVYGSLIAAALSSFVLLFGRIG